MLKSPKPGQLHRRGLFSGHLYHYHYPGENRGALSVIMFTTHYCLFSYN